MKQQDRDRRKERRKQTWVMAAATTETDNGFDDAANESLDMAAASAHWYRLRVQHKAEGDETARALLESKREAKRDAKAEAQQRKSEAKHAELLASQRKKAVAITKVQVKYEVRRQQAADAKVPRDAAKQRMVSLRRASTSEARHAASSAYFADCRAFKKALNARTRAGDRLRGLPQAPKQLVKEARDGAAWAVELDSMGGLSRSHLSLRRRMHPRRLEPFHLSRLKHLCGERSGSQGFTLPRTPISMSTQSTCRLSRPSDASKLPLPTPGAAIVKPPTPCAWQRAQETLFEEWYCDVAGDGCLRPSAASPEPELPYDVWSCVECESFALCGACHASGLHEHTHALRLYHMMPWV